MWKRGIVKRTPTEEEVRLLARQVEVIRRPDLSGRWRGEIPLGTRRRRRVNGILV